MHGYHFPGVIQLPKGIEVDGRMILRIPIDNDCEIAIENGIANF